MSEHKFTFKEVDHEGLKTLKAMAASDNFNRWMYDTIKPYTGGRILEIGSGIGNISQFFLQNSADITLSDLRDNYLSVLHERFGTDIQIMTLDLVHPDFEHEYEAQLNSFDTLFALNVVEHIENDTQAIKNARKLLKPGAKMIILVPAYQSLYNQFDKQLLHFRRYTLNTLRPLFRDNKLKVIQSTYFNFVGILGWFVSGQLMGKKTIPEGQMSIYNKLVPLIKLVDKLLMGKIGLSVIMVGEKSVRE